MGGMPLLDHILRGVNAIGEVDEIHVVSNDKFYPQFRAWADAHGDARLRVHNDGTREDGARLGAIGDIAFALRQGNIDDDCLIVAGDNLLMIDYADFFRAYAARGRRPLLLAQKMDDVATLRRFAVAELDAQGRVLRLVESPRSPRARTGSLRSTSTPPPPCAASRSTLRRQQPGRAGELRRLAQRAGAGLCLCDRAALL